DISTLQARLAETAWTLQEVRLSRLGPGQTGILRVCAGGTAVLEQSTGTQGHPESTRLLPPPGGVAEAGVRGRRATSGSAATSDHAPGGGESPALLAHRGPSRQQQPGSTPLPGRD